jgi:hypothetical protein
MIRHILGEPFVFTECPPDYCCCGCYCGDVRVSVDTVCDNALDIDWE